MGGVELIIALILAGAVTNAARQGTARAGEAWASHRQRRQDKAREREQRAQARARQTRRRIDAAEAWVARRSRNPAHPVGWAYGLGWALAAAGGAAVAGVRGARHGAAAGAREGAAIGRRAAREGWGWATAWREWKRQRDADEAQRDRAHGRAKQAGASAGGTTPDPPPVMVACRGCGAFITNARAGEADGLCPACCGPAAEPHHDTPHGERDGGVQDAVVLEDLPTCFRCGVTIDDGSVTPIDEQLGLVRCRACARPATRRAGADRDEASDAGRRPAAPAGDGHRSCPRCVRSTADGPVYPHCQDTHSSVGDNRENDSDNDSDSDSEKDRDREELVTTDTTSIQQGALTSGHEGGEMGIEDTRTIYRQISAQGATVGELIDRLATSLGHFGASAADITEAQQVAEAAEALVTAAENARANHDSRNTMTEQAAVEETDAVRDTDYHRLGK